MRIITKDITLMIDGNQQKFRLIKPDAFSGVEVLRLVMRLQDQWEKAGRNVGDDHSSSGRTRNESKGSRSRPVMKFYLPSFRFICNPEQIRFT